MKNLKSSLITVPLLCVLLVLGSCGNSDNAPSTSETNAIVSSEPATETPESPPEASADAEHYPVEIITYDYSGNEVVTVYHKAPERVLAVYQGSIETMIALGLEERVIASYGLDNEVKDEWKDGFSRMNYNDSSFAPDRESVVMMNPDLIFSWGSLLGETMLGDVDYWHANGTNTYINTNTRRGGSRLLENEYTDLLNIGKIFNVEDRAEALVNQMKSDIDKARSAVVETGEKPLVAVIRVNENNIRNYGMELAGDIVKTIGVEVMESETNTMGKEDLVASNPDIIFVEYMPRPDLGGDELKYESLSKVVDDPAFASISAVVNGRVYPIMLGDIYAPAVRTADGIHTIANGLFPGLLD